MAQRLDTWRGRVFGLTAFERSDAGFFNVLGGIKIGLTGSETTDVFTRSLKRFGFSIDGQSRRRRDVTSPSGEKRES